MCEPIVPERVVFMTSDVNDGLVTTIVRSCKRSTTRPFKETFEYKFNFVSLDSEGLGEGHMVVLTWENERHWHWAVAYIKH